MKTSMRTYPDEVDSLVARVDDRTGIGARVGQVVRVEASGRVYVDFPGNPHGPTVARVALTSSDKAHLARRPKGSAVLLLFEDNDPRRPIVTGVVSDRLENVVEIDLDPSTASKEIFADNKRLFLNSEQEIVLNCGKSSIVLRKDGKIVIRGVEVISRAAQRNRIKGGSVKIN